MRRNYFLECGHRKSFDKKRPRPHEILWCFVCNDYSAIRDEPGPWALYCLDCVYRKGNQGEIAARTYAAKHMATRRHVVYSWRIGLYTTTLEKHAPTERRVHVGITPPY